MSKLILNTTEFEHIKEKSSYNCHYFRHKEQGYEIFEEYDEFSNDYRFSLIEEINYQTVYPVFIGFSNKGFNDAEVLELDFKEQWS